MFSIFNRKELTITYSMKEQGSIREVLEKYNIEYQVKVINRKSSSALRARTGGFGERIELENEYIFYVKKEEYDYAKSLLF